MTERKIHGNMKRRRITALCRIVFGSHRRTIVPQHTSIPIGFKYEDTLISSFLLNKKNTFRGFPTILRIKLASAAPTIPNKGMKRRLQIRLMVVAMKFITGGLSESPNATKEVPSTLLTTDTVRLNMSNVNGIALARYFSEKRSWIMSFPTSRTIAAPRLKVKAINRVDSFRILAA
jgi:hypothetical protein